MEHPDAGNTVVLANLQRLDSSGADQGIYLVSPNIQGVGDDLHAEEQGHRLKGCVSHGRFLHSCFGHPSASFQKVGPSHLHVPVTIDFLFC